MARLVKIESPDLKPVTSLDELAKRLKRRLDHLEIVRRHHVKHAQWVRLIEAAEMADTYAIVLEDLGLKYVKPAKRRG